MSATTHHWTAPFRYRYVAELYIYLGTGISERPGETTEIMREADIMREAKIMRESKIMREAEIL